MRPADATLDRLRALPVPTLSACLFARGYTNMFLHGLTPLDPKHARFVGIAYTLKAVPTRPDKLKAIDAGTAPNLHRRAMAALVAGDVLVTDTSGAERISLLGEIITTFLARKGVAAVVTDAGVADVVDVAPIGLPIFARGSAPVPGSAQVLAAALQVPVSCRGVAVYPGDVLVGDANGVVVIPPELADDIAHAAADKEELERFLLARVQGGAPLDGTYPPDQATLDAYARHRAGTLSASAASTKASP